MNANEHAAAPAGTVDLGNPPLPGGLVASMSANRRPAGIRSLDPDVAGLDDLNNVDIDLEKAKIQQPAPLSFTSSGGEPVAVVTVDGRAARADIDTSFTDSPGGVA